MKYTKEEKQRSYDILKEYRGQNFGCIIKSVSRSGMSRRMEFYSKDFRRLGYHIACLLDMPYNVDKGLSVGGCGMDMIFSVLSNLNYEMAKRDTGKTIQELLKTKECGEHIYDYYYTDASHYTYL